MLLVLCQRTVHEVKVLNNISFFFFSLRVIFMPGACQSMIYSELIFVEGVTLTNLAARCVAMSETNCLLNAQTQQARMILSGLGV